MWYNLKTIHNGYRMVKFDDLLNVEAIYELKRHRGRMYCDCPQGLKAPTCRHREMVKIFTDHKGVDTGEFYCYETEQWMRIED